MKRHHYLIFGLTIIFLILSFSFDYQPGKEIGKNLGNFLVSMLMLLPCAFILIGLFEVWVKRETVEKHFGKQSKIMGYIYAILLSSTAVGGLYVALPVAYTLHNKGARLSIVFTYLYAACICRIPMTVFEATFVGLKFTLIRLFTSLILVLTASLILERHLEKRSFQMNCGQSN